VILRFQNAFPIRKVACQWNSGKGIYVITYVTREIILKRWDGLMWTGLVWLRIGTSGELL
jgi:hypothetical protein